MQRERGLAVPRVMCSKRGSHSMRNSGQYHAIPLWKVCSMRDLHFWTATNSSSGDSLQSTEPP
eukprot:1159114-Pelagomonas_calceolata.AAC.3